MRCRFANTNGSSENRFEIGNLLIYNNMPGAKYADVLTRYMTGKDRSENSIMIRVYSKGGVPSKHHSTGIYLHLLLVFNLVGGIPVMELFEINTVPLTVQLTEQ